MFFVKNVAKFLHLRNILKRRITEKKARCQIIILGTLCAKLVVVQYREMAVKL